MFIAVTRFSVYQPKSSAWIVSKNATDEEGEKKYKDTLFNEDRLNFRLGFLANVTLPLLEKASKGHDFVHVIEYSSILQEKYIDILKKLKQKYSFVELNEYNDAGISETTNYQLAIKHFKLNESKKDVLVSIFVLDDDDCISLDFFEKSKKYLNNMFIGFAVSYGLGVYGIFNKNGEVINVTESYYPKVNIGLMRIGIYRHEKNIINFPRLGTHTKADRYLPTIIDSREISYWWSKHSSQDTTNIASYMKGYDNLKSAVSIEKSIISSKFGNDFLDNIKSIENGFNI